MNNNQPWKKPWYVQRSGENNTRHGLETMVNSTSINSDYSADNNPKGFLDYASRVAKIAMITGLAGLLYLTSACAQPEPASIPQPIPAPAPAPEPAPEPAPTILELLDKELSQFPNYAQNEIQVLRQEALSDDIVTQKEADNIRDVVGNPLFLTVSKDDNLTDKFDLQNFTSLFKELNESSYKDELMKRITSADARENVSQAWNYKVRREDDVLHTIIPKHQTGFNGNSAEAWQFRFDNGSYHLKLWTDGNSIMDLSNHGLKEWFENKEDKEFAMMQFWVPDGMIEYDISQWKYSGGFQSFLTGIRNNMDVILGNKKINGLNQYENLRDRIVNVSNDHSIKSYPKPQVYGTDFEHAVAIWGRQTDNVPQSGLLKVPELYRTQVIPILEEKMENFELIKLAYGLGVLDKGNNDIESSDTRINQIYQKALGYISFEQLGRVPTDIGDRQYVAFVVSKQILQQLPSNSIVYRGQSVSPWSMEDGRKSDGVKYVREPNGSKIIWNHPNMKK